MIDVRKSLAWSFMSTYSSLIINIISVMIVSRILTPGQKNTRDAAQASGIIGPVLAF